MIKSMTGFAVAEIGENRVTVGIEVRSYNSRHLDVMVRMPHGYQVLEEKIKAVVAEVISRGRVEIAVRIMDASEASHRYQVDMAKARAYYQSLCELGRGLGLDDPPSLELVLRAGDIVIAEDTGDAVMEKAWPAVERCLRNALDQHSHMRKMEGDFLYEDVKRRLQDIGSGLLQIEKESQGLLEIYQERLKQRVQALTRNVVEIDMARIAQEAALIADKSDITEEIIRSKSHIEQFVSIMDGEEPAGRKLNFLLQEFNREFNTMGSKTQNADVAHLVVAVKSELEKIREQVQNVE